MNRLLTLVVFGGAIIALSTSCKKCATCTTLSDDPATAGQTITDEVCGVGRDYDDKILIYERGSWTCSEE